MYNYYKYKQSTRSDVIYVKLCTETGYYSAKLESDSVWTESKIKLEDTSFDRSSLIQMDTSEAIMKFLE